MGNNKYLDSIFEGKVFLKGIDGVKKYNYTIRSIITVVELPFIIISIIYQIIKPKLR